ncbi:MAG: class I SAM-dependent methyltransferase [Anaerolineae bacterium]|nr:class I SAM-dependent methyltransferase [Anaerolineae bacterium]
MSGDIYRQIAPYYDLIHARLTQDVGFSLALAARNRGSVLELGCGTGRLLLPLARAGHPVTGLDNSMPMLLQAQRALAGEPAEVRQRARLVAGDMTTFAFAKEHFSLVLVPYNTFMHLDATAAAAAVRAVARHLQPRGRLFLDLANPFVVEQTPGDRLLSLEQILTDPDTGAMVVITASNQLYPGAQQLEITWLYDASPAGGGPVERSVAQVNYHYYFPHQIELLLRQSGLRLEALYGDYNEEPFDEAAERLLVLAHKSS